MSLHQHPESLITGDALTADQRDQLDPASRAAIGLHDIAIALSDAGFEVYADTWRLIFREPACKGWLGWLKGKKLELEIRAHDSDRYTIYPTFPTRKVPDPVAGDMSTIMRFVSHHFPNRSPT